MAIPVIAIIPSRGGSQRIPLKSLEKIGGRSLLQRTIETALKSQLFDRIVVSTDNNQIATEALKFGSEVPKLRTTASDDISPVSSATIHTLEQLIEMEQKYVNAIVYQLMPNCPFLSVRTLTESFNRFQLNPSQSLLSSVKADPINWFAFKFNELGAHERIIKGIDGNSRTQDHQAMFVPSGSVWIARASYLLENKSYYGEIFSFFEIPFIEGIDIDTMEQLEFARVISRGLGEPQK